VSAVNIISEFWGGVTTAVNHLPNSLDEINCIFDNRDCKLLLNFSLSRFSRENFIQQYTNWEKINITTAII